MDSVEVGTLLRFPLLLLPLWPPQTAGFVLPGITVSPNVVWTGSPSAQAVNVRHQIVLFPMFLLAHQAGFVPASQPGIRCHEGFHHVTPGRQQLPTSRGHDRLPKAASVMYSFESPVPFPSYKLGYDPPPRRFRPFHSALEARPNSPLHKFVSKVDLDHRDVLEPYLGDFENVDRQPTIPAEEAPRGWWPLEESLVSRGSGDSLIYTFESQFALEQELGLFDDGGSGSDGALPPPSAAAAADIDFLRGLDMEEMLACYGAGYVPLRRLMISPATTAAGEASEVTEGKLHPAYDIHNPPTPATLVADLKATDFRTAITNLDDDGAGGPIPYVGYPQSFAYADQVHEDEHNNYLFCTPEDFAESVAADDVSEVEIRGRAHLAALRKYALDGRVFFIALHTDRWDPSWYVECFPEGCSSDVLLLALGVSISTGNLVGLMALQVAKNLTD